MTRARTFFILCLTSCLVPQTLVVAVAQNQQSEATVEPTKTAETTTTGADGTTSPALTGVRRPLYRLRKSDVVEIDFTFSPQINQIVTVQPDGYIPLKAVEPLFVEGLSVPELQAAVRQAYTGMLHDPEVTVVLKDFDRPSFVAAGEVGRPGKYELRADTTVTEAVAIAGGFTPRAKHSQIVLFRRISDETVESHLLNVKAMLQSRTLAEDVHLQPGDVLYVPQNLISKIRQFLPASSLSLYANSAGF